MNPAFARSTPSACLPINSPTIALTAPANPPRSSRRFSAAALLLPAETSRISSLRNLSPKERMSTGARRTMKCRKIVAAVLTILACAALALAAQKGSPGVFAQDKGKLTINLDGQTVGREDFEIAPSGAGWR